MGINKFFINKILKSVPFEISCIDKKTQVQGADIKGFEVSVPIINYKRLWSQTSDYAGRNRWQVQDEELGAFSQSYSLPRVAGNDPIQKLTIAMLIDIQGFCFETSLSENLKETSNEFSIAITLHFFLTEIVPTSIFGPYAKEIITYAYSESNTNHQMFLKRIESNEEIKMGNSKEAVIEEINQIAFFSGFLDDRPTFAGEETAFFETHQLDKSFNYEAGFVDLLSRDLPNFEIENVDFLQATQCKAVIIPLFTFIDGVSRVAQMVQIFYISEGLWSAAEGIKSANNISIHSEESQSLFAEDDYKGFIVQVHLRLGRRLISALYSEPIEVHLPDRKLSVSRLSRIIASMRWHSELSLEDDEQVWFDFGEAHDQIYGELPAKYFEEIAALPKDDKI